MAGDKTEVLGERKVLEEFEIQPSTLRRAFKAGELKINEVRRKVFVKRGELEAWISKQVPKKGVANG